MPWTPLLDRLDELPLILAGPILRRTEPTAVTVWVALRNACEVMLQVYATEYGNGLVLNQLVLEGKRQTVAIGKHLHLVAVTAQTKQAPLHSEHIYAYDLTFQIQAASGDCITQTLQQALTTEQTPLVPISYFEHRLPTFVLPPQNLNQLKLLHGSCRKPHGEGPDTLAIVDHLLEQQASSPLNRPQQLFLTGDQIYGDDVADPFLWVLTDAADTLLGWEEDLPINTAPSAAVPPLKAKHLPPGERSNVIEKLGGFTAGLQNKPELTSSHLLSFGEYCSAYLFGWSPVLWATEFVTGNERYHNRKRAKKWDEAVEDLYFLQQSLWKVRRALANIATYMVFDDHDISDDWYLNQEWCLRVLGKPLGRRTVQNGLLAYAVFQAWGNTPDQFQAGQAGEQLLQAAQTWSASGGTDETAGATIARLLGLPDLNPTTGMPLFRQDQQVWILDHHPKSLQWHYTVRSNCHEVVVLDTRTWRGYPIDADDTAPPMLLSPSAFDQQIRQPLQQSQNQHLQTLVVAPTNLIHLRIIDWAQEWSLKQGKVFHNDVGDAWNLNKAALAELLTALFETREQVVVLSGDIHYGFAARLDYWQRHSSTAEAQKSVLVQLTSSAFKNAEWKTQVVSTKLKSLLPEVPQVWAGWYQSPQLWEVQATPGAYRWVKLPPATKLPLIKRLKFTQGNEELAWSLAVRQPQFLPDWCYQIEWVQRQKSVSYHKSTAWLSPQQKRTGWQQVLYWLSWPWRNRWLQEGKEVVGYSNFGLVQFRSSTPDGSAHTVFQDLYWCPPWRPNSVVTSRFEAPLQSETSNPAWLLMQKY